MTGTRPSSRFRPGQSGNPTGRPKGARNKLGEAFLEELAADFAANGRGVIETVRREKPDQYLRVIASVLPREIHATTSNRPAHELTDAELLAIVNGSDSTGDNRNAEQ